MGDGIAGFRFRWGSLIAVITVLLLAIILSKNFLFSFSLKENAFELASIIVFVGPAFIAALFVERAVEVVVTTWRKLGREQLEASLVDENANLAASIQVDQAGIAEKVGDLKKEIARYRRDTLQMAVGFSLGFSFIVTLVGVRLLSQFFDIPFIDCIPDPILTEPEECPTSLEGLRSDYRWLVGVDIFITTFVIAGGSEGVHSIVSAITSFADRTAQTAKQGS